MPIRLTDEQWANVVEGNEVPVARERSEGGGDVRARARTCTSDSRRCSKKIRSPNRSGCSTWSSSESTGWDDPEMDVYNELDLRP